MTRPRSRARRRGAGRRRSQPRERQARVGHLVQQVVASELARLDPDAGPMITVTGVDVDAEFHVARVYVDHLDRERAAVLEGVRTRLQRAVGRQIRLRRTPTLVFAADPAIEAGERVEEILRGIDDHER